MEKSKIGRKSEIMRIDFKGQIFKETVGSIPVRTVFTGKGESKKFLYLKTENSVATDNENKESGEQYCSCLRLTTLTPIEMPAEMEIKPLYFPEKIVFE